MIRRLERERYEHLLRSIPLGRIGPADIAGVALFLASDLSRYVAGELGPPQPLTNAVRD